MRFWDSSALIALLVVESNTEAMIRLRRQDPQIVVWWSTEVECASALAGLERAGAVREPATSSAMRRLEELSQSWVEIPPTEQVRAIAKRLLRVHPLRAADALQLAAATVASEGSPISLEFVSFDDRLRTVASREGFVVI